MNNKEQAIEQIEEFLQSNEKGMFLTGRNQYEKHKLIAVLEKTFEIIRFYFGRTACRIFPIQNTWVGPGVKRTGWSVTLQYP